MKFLPLILVLILALTACTPAPTEAVTTASVFDLVQFVQSFVLGSTMLATIVAMLVNIFKPFIPDGYADTAAVLATFALALIATLLKIFNPDLTLGALDELFRRIVESSPAWLVPLTMLVAWLAKKVHQTFLRGIPFVGRSNSKPNILSKGARLYNDRFAASRIYTNDPPY